MLTCTQQSCISEAEKYQGSLYKGDNRDNRAKAKAKPSVNGSARPPRKAYVEDAPDGDIDGFISNPPHAPSPPTAKAVVASQDPSVNVFDFLVNEETPNASRAALPDEPPSPEPMKMVQNAPAVFEATRQLQQITNGNESRETLFGESKYEQTGFHYGDGPVPVAGAAAAAHNGYLTPAPLHERERLRQRDRAGKGEHNKSDKKRKRVQLEELDLSAARSQSDERDEIMTDAPPMLHSGLTGGLKGLLTRTSEYPPSPEYSSGDRHMVSPGSPLKRSKHAREHKNTSTGTSTALVPVSSRHHSSSRHIVSTARPHKRGRKHRTHSSAPSSRRLKAIEYHPTPATTNGLDDSRGQMVVYRSRAELFLSFVNKGPESEKGCSINKALKRFHRERSESGVGLPKGDDEKELWKSLRLRRNDRGEIVLLTDPPLY
ncbi:MAG: hypothetical protein M1825_000349 [Sarcosagium campestre]|nr:MAG: hypothetical protein M1825_000349 [Sarcosagium campestre]